MMAHAFKQYLFTTILCLYAIAGSSQTAWIDSVKKVAASQLADTGKLSNLLGLTFAYKQFHPDSSISYGQQSLALSKQLDDQDGVFGSEVALSQSLMITGNYPLALEYSFKARESAKKVKDTTAISYADFMLSDCYYYLEDYNTSLVYLRKVISAIETKCPNAMSQIWPNLSRLFNTIHHADSALHYAKASYEILKRNPCKLGDYHLKSQISRICPLLGDAFHGNADYDSAKYYYRMGMQISQPIYLQTDLIDDYNGLAAVFRLTGEQDSAIWYARKVLAEPIVNTYPVGLLHAVNMLASVYESVNKPDSTLKYLKISASLKDSLFNSDKTIAVQNLIYKEQEKQKELIAAKAELQKQYKFYAFAAGTAVLLIISGILLKNRRQKQLQHMRNSIADDLHDDIGSTLSSISIMNELAKQKSPEALTLLESIGESTISLQENMSDIVWAINPKNDRFENVLQRMTQFATEILDAKNIELDFTNDESLTTTRLTMHQRKNFYLFFKEVINNAAKYSEADKIHVSILKKDHHIEMKISDNGKGFDTSGMFKGNGMNTLKKRGEELKAFFNIQSKPTAGTLVQLKFKIT